MEGIVEKAKNYAEGKVNEALTQAIAKAYLEGYQDGYRDCEAKLPIDISNEEVEEDDVEYVDLGLPSGTLWAKDYKKESNEVLYLPYGKASCLNIPTEEQWNELEEECVFQYINYNPGNLAYAVCIGPNGNTIVFNTKGMIKYINIEQKEYGAYFWLKEEEGNSSKTAIKIYDPNYLQCKKI